MGKKSSPPAAPDYQAFEQQTNQQNAANIRTGIGQNRFTDIGPTGRSSWRLRPGASGTQPGDYVRETQLSEAQQRLLTGSERAGNLAGIAGVQQLGDIRPSLDATNTLSDLLYRRSTANSERRFGREQDTLEAKLINSGLARGSDAWKNELQTFNDRKDVYYANAADTAAINAEQQAQTNQNNAVARAGNLLDMQQGAIQMPTPANDWDAPVLPAPDLAGLASQQYGQQLGANNAANAQRSNQVGSIVMAAAVAY